MIPEWQQIAYQVFSVHELRSAWARLRTEYKNKSISRAGN
jgi:hypothetical protein